MNIINLGKLFENYYGIFEKLGTFLMNESDKMINYYIFEETDISIGFSSKRILMNLLDEGIIDEVIFEKSMLLQRKFRELEGTEIWNLDSVKSAPEWRFLMELSDEIKVLIKTRWTEDEISELFNLTQATSLND